MTIRNPSPGYRIVLIGDSSVGKTSIINRLVNQTFNYDEQTTVGGLFCNYREEVDKTKIEMQIWDTAGQERFQSLSPIYYRNSSAGIVVFDVTNSASFKHLDNWISNFITHAGSDALVVIAANKSDLVSSSVVTSDHISEWLRDKHFRFFEVSAKSGSGVAELFRYVAQELNKVSKSRAPIVTPGVSSLPKPVEEQEKCLC